MIQPDLHVRRNARHTNPGTPSRPPRRPLERAEAELAKLYAHVPETGRTKKADLDAEERRLANSVDFIGEGRGSRAFGKTLQETELRVEALRDELDGLRRSDEGVFQAPPIEWVEERFTHVQEVLIWRTEQSALLLRNFFGRIRLE